MATRSNRVIPEGATSVGQLFKFFRVPKRGGLYRLEDLVQADTINPRSKHKPMRYDKDTIYEPTKGDIYSKLTKLTDDMRREGNYGHRMVVYPNAVEAIQGVASETNFPYERPISWSRLKDFFGYNDDAELWHNIYTPIGSVNVDSSVEVRITDIEAFFDLGTPKQMGLNLMTANLGLLMWNEAFSAEQPQVWYYNLTDMREAGKQLVDLKDNLRISTADIPVGTWRMYPCITDVVLGKDTMTYMRADGNYEGNWIPLPYCNTHTLEVVTSGGADNLIGSIIIEKDKIESDIELLDAASLTYRMSKLAISFTNTGDVDYTFSFDTGILNAYNPVGEFDLAGSDIIIMGGETLEFVWELKEGYYRFSVIETPVQLEVTYWMTVNGQPQSIKEPIVLTN